MSMTPREIVHELNRHIVGQDDAKRAVAIALRNRWRRMQLPEELRVEVTPKNILMIGPTGVGKTEIARRLAKLANAPFIKVEATKFTEVGYVGRDVESIIRDLADAAIKLLREQEIIKVRHRAEDAAEERILDALLPPPRMGFSNDDAPTSDSNTRQLFRKRLREGQLDDKEIEIEVAEMAGVDISAPPGMEEMTNQLQSLFANMGKGKRKSRKLKVKEALKLVRDEEAGRLVNDEELKAKALEAVEQHGIVFIDEIDKVAKRGNVRRRRRVPRRRAARLAAADRRLHRQHQTGHGQDRPHPVHRLRRVPPEQAERSGARAARSPADSCRTEGAVAGRLRTHPQRAARFAHRAILCTAENRRPDHRVPARAASNALRKSPGRSTRKPKTSVPVVCTRCLSACLKRCRSAPATWPAPMTTRRSRSTLTTSTATSANWRRTKTCPVISCKQHL